MCMGIHVEIINTYEVMFLRDTRRAMGEDEGGKEV